MCRIFVPSSILPGLMNLLASIVTSAGCTCTLTLGHRGHEAALDSLEVEGFSREEASTELGQRGRGGALASLEAQGFTGEGGTRTASTELARRGGVARSAIYRKSENCSYAGCTNAIHQMIHNRGYCDHHCPKKPEKPEKSDKCRVCGRVFIAKEQVRGGVCNACYKKPEATAARKKVMAEKKSARKS
jgi:hypothetical protein